MDSYRWMFDENGARNDVIQATTEELREYMDPTRLDHLLGHGYHWLYDENGEAWAGVVPPTIEELQEYMHTLDILATPMQRIVRRHLEWLEREERQDLELLEREERLHAERVERRKAAKAANTKTPLKPDQHRPPKHDAQQEDRQDYAPRAEPPMDPGEPPTEPPAEPPSEPPRDAGEPPGEPPDPGEPLEKRSRITEPTPPIFNAIRAPLKPPKKPPKMYYYSSTTNRHSPTPTAIQSRLKYSEHTTNRSERGFLTNPLVRLDFRHTRANPAPECYVFSTDVRDRSRGAKKMVDAIRSGRMNNEHTVFRHEMGFLTKPPARLDFGHKLANPSPEYDMHSSDVLDQSFGAKKMVDTIRSGRMNNEHTVFRYEMGFLTKPPARLDFGHKLANPSPEYDMHSSDVLDQSFSAKKMVDMANKMVDMANKIVHMANKMVDMANKMVDTAINIVTRITRASQGPLLAKPIPGYSQSVLLGSRSVNGRWSACSLGSL